MPSHYETLKQPDLYPAAFRVEAPEDLGERLMRPRKLAQILILGDAEPAPETAPESAPLVDPAVPADPAADAAPTAPATPARTALRPRKRVAAQWGLVPHWVKSASDGDLRAIKLLQAKSDNLTSGIAFREAWLAGQRCIVPMMAFFEDDWRTNKAISTRIARVDGQPMGAAGVWARWRDADGTELLSFALITINANAHQLMNRYQRAGAEKSMPAIVTEGAYDAWLNAPVHKSKEFLRAYPAQKLLANPVEKKGTKNPLGI